MNGAKSQALVAALNAVLGDAIVVTSESRGEVTIELQPADVSRCMPLLKTHDELHFEQLSDLSAVDYLTYGQADWQTRGATNSGFSRAVAEGAGGQPSEGQGRFAVVYHLLSVKHNWRLRVRTRLSEELPRVASVCELWPVANWYEREAFDLFGILFTVSVSWFDDNLGLFVDLGIGQRGLKAGNEVSSTNHTHHRGVVSTLLVHFVFLRHRLTGGLNQVTAFAIVQFIINVDNCSFFHSLASKG